MKFFIILTVLVSGLSVHAKSVLETSPEIFEVGSVLNWTPPAKAVETRPSRGIASEVASPSCPESDPNCGQTGLQAGSAHSIGDRNSGGSLGGLQGQLGGSTRANPTPNPATDGTDNKNRSDGGKGYRVGN